MAEPYDLQPFMHKKKTMPEIVTDIELTNENVAASFSGSTSGGAIRGNHLEYGRTLVGATVEYDITKEGDERRWFLVGRDYNHGADQYLHNLVRRYEIPLRGYTVAAVTAERNVVEEGESFQLEVAPDGAGATNLIQRILNDSERPGELIESELLGGLNRIMGPDARFTRITTQRTSEAKWTVFLDEEKKGRVSLSDSGSGLKTILLVLLNMLVLPKLKNADAAKHVFMFEELENNLHPGLQRRLLHYIKEQVEKLNAVVFITTHSPAVIDIFSRSDNVQILHVTHNGESAAVRPIECLFDGHNVLDDLDVRASDLLQTNGVIWVEGISDAIYIRKWMRLYCAQEGIELPVEGSEFAFMEYGGRCLAHMDFASATHDQVVEGDIEWLIPALALSRHTYLVMDSDRKGGNSKLNATKMRASEQAGGSWVTEGREIENYLSPGVATEIVGKKLNLYDSAAKAFKDNKKLKTFDKKAQALRAASLMTADNWKHRDLEGQISRLVRAIGAWNPKVE